MVTAEQVDFYRTNGYLIVEDVFPMERIEEARCVVDELVERSRLVTASDATYDIEPGHTPAKPMLRRIKSPDKQHPVLGSFIRSDAVLDILTASRGTGRPHPAGDGALDPETRRFLASAAVEGEILDAQTNALLAEGVDPRRRGAPAFDTWAEVNRAFAFWADRVCTRLEARAGVR